MLLVIILKIGIAGWDRWSRYMDEIVVMIAMDGEMTPCSPGVTDYRGVTQMPDCCGSVHEVVINSMNIFSRCGSYFP